MELGQLAMLVCVLPTALLIVIGAVIVWNFSRFVQALPQFTAPDTGELQERYEALKTAKPDATQAQLVRTIINRYALRQGLVGAATGVGGFLALPLGLLIDVVYSARSNASLSYFIAQVYGIQNEDKTLNVAQLLVLRQRKVSAAELIMWQEQFAGVAFQGLLRSLLRKTVAKFIPGAGAVIGFLVNYSSAQFFGTLADQYYRGNLTTLLGTAGDRLRGIKAPTSESPDALPAPPSVGNP